MQSKEPGPKYSPEVRERAVRRVQEHRGEYPSLWAAIESMAPKIGCVPQTRHEWVRKHEVDTGLRDGVTTEERERLKALEREVKALRQANEILNLASAFFARAGLDRRLKSRTRSSTNPVIPTGSSRSARCCRLPLLGIGAIRPSSATPAGFLHVPDAMRFRPLKSSALATPPGRATRSPRHGPR